MGFELKIFQEMVQFKIEQRIGNLIGSFKSSSIDFSQLLAKLRPKFGRAFKAFFTIVA